MMIATNSIRQQTAQQPLITDQKQEASRSNQSHQKSRLQYDPRAGMRESLISPRLTTILEFACFTTAVIAFTAGATLGIAPLIALGAIAFASPFLILPFLTRSYY